VVLIGPNGAGKTTFIDAITGFTSHTGRVIFKEHDVDSVSPHGIARLGLRRTWQSVELFNDVSVADNLRVSMERSGPKAITRDLLLPHRSSDDAVITSALERVGLTGVSSMAPSELSLGQQKLLGVARALVAEPSLLLLDEPAAGLSTSETESLGHTIVDIANKGTSILLIDHDMDLVFATCDYIYVLDFGRIIATGTPEQISNDPAVLEAYLGQADE
jgi:ABC-type branched-subunit amino acid transport system ATPase component